MSRFPDLRFFQQPRNSIKIPIKAAFEIFSAIKRPAFTNVRRTESTFSLRIVSEIFFKNEKSKTGKISNDRKKNQQQTTTLNLQCRIFVNSIPELHDFHNRQCRALLNTTDNACLDGRGISGCSAYLELKGGSFLVGDEDSEVRSVSQSVKDAELALLC
eukprot:jgi/Bigna1/129046/aug1.8_g3754